LANARANGKILKIFYSTHLFNGLQIGQFDPFGLETISPDRATITISLQCGRTRDKAKGSTDLLGVS
jgi:hypothetical protein